MLVLAGGLAALPAIGSQGAGALGARQLRDDVQLLQSNDPFAALQAAHALTERQVVGLTSR